MRYISILKTTFRKTNRYSGEMDDVVKNIKELKQRCKDGYYTNKMLIFVENESQIYRISVKEKLMPEALARDI